MNLMERFAAAHPDVLAGETWGISGPAFLSVYIPVGILAVAAGVWLRRNIDRSAAAPEKLTAPEIAMLHGDQRPVMAALALLRSHGLIDSRATPTRAMTPADRAQLDWFTLAIFDRLTPQEQTAAGVAAAAGAQLGQLRASLTERGYMPDAVFRRAARDAGMPIAIVGIFGVVRFFAGLINGNPTLFLFFVLAALAIAWRLVAHPGRVTGRGAEAKKRAVSEHTYLRPRNSPAYATYGVGAAAIAVAVFGTSALTVLDPGLASAVDAPTGGADGGGGSDGGGGDGGGGGGGCGGGGCGG